MDIYYKHIDNPYIYAVYNKALNILLITTNPAGMQGAIFIV